MNDEILKYLTRVITNSKNNEIIFSIMDKSKTQINANILRNELMNEFQKVLSISYSTMEKKYYISFDFLETLEIIKIDYLNKEKIVSLTDLGQRLFLIKIKEKSNSQKN